MPYIRRVKFYSSFILIYICCSLYCRAQYDKDSLYEYFKSTHNINIDSAKNTTFYRTFYDWKDVKYRMAGNNLKGIDCSHFSAVMYKNAYDKILTGSAADYYKTIDSTFTTKADLQEGDLLFFKIRSKRVSHVGVYLQKNKFAHATVKAGVIISDLNESYYKKYYYAAGRYKNLALPIDNSISSISLTIDSSLLKISKINPYIREPELAFTLKKKNNNKFKKKTKVRAKSKKKKHTVAKHKQLKNKKKKK